MYKIPDPLEALNERITLSVFSTSVILKLKVLDFVVNQPFLIMKGFKLSIDSAFVVSYK